MGNGNPFGHQRVPLHSEKVILWCKFTTSFIVGLFFSEEIGPAGSVTCTTNGARFESLLRNHVIAALEQRACVGNTIFMQDSAPSHIANPV
ncbi:hypothetical protein AVEN_13041-1 [Araneus ventricosus]|uniref:Tc1-like transposase DDE domain-containing protein n=1 Tax=Araneus ventricosus TaxID=182803 RepID=A0A4Y2ILE0_ARAVE|nr:hypothetical protein AVEN_13041-1 [Araneus ventricosus]